MLVRPLRGRGGRRLFLSAGGSFATRPRSGYYMCDLVEVVSLQNEIIQTNNLPKNEIIQTNNLPKNEIIQTNNSSKNEIFQRNNLPKNEIFQRNN